METTDWPVWNRLMRQYVSLTEVEKYARGGLRLHKFISNDRAVIESIPESERAADVKLDIPSEQLPIERVLGMQ